jgi:flavorubredoxin
MSPTIELSTPYGCVTVGVKQSAKPNQVTLVFSSFAWNGTFELPLSSIEPFAIDLAAKIAAAKGDAL